MNEMLLWHFGELFEMVKNRFIMPVDLPLSNKEPLIN
jgi:hypothetical protein